MAIVRVAAGVFLRTEFVGKIIQTQCVESSVRKTQTDIFDSTVNMSCGQSARLFQSTIRLKALKP